MSEVWTTLKVLDWTTGRFERAGLDSPRLDAQVLLAHVLKCPRVALYTAFDQPLAQEELGSYRALIQRRLDGEPVAYLTGTQEFWSLKFAVDKRVLIPRPDTETLVQVALELVPKAAGAARVADIATGSGAVAIALAHERPQWQVVATDLHEGPVEVAKKNAEANGVADRVQVRQGNLLAPLAGERFHLLVSNPPYIAAAEMEGLPVDVKTEPSSALLGGETGLELIENLVAAAREHLESGGWVAIEHGFAQGQGVRDIAERHGFRQVQTRSDLAGRARVTYFCTDEAPASATTTAGEEASDE